MLEEEENNKLLLGLMSGEENSCRQHLVSGIMIMIIQAYDSFVCGICYVPCDFYVEFMHSVKGLVRLDLFLHMHLIVLSWKNTLSMLSLSHTHTYLCWFLGQLPFKENVFHEFLDAQQLCYLS